MPYYVVFGNHDLSPTDMPKPFPAPPPARGQTRFNLAWVFQGKGFQGPNLDWVAEPVPGLILIGLDVNSTYDWNGHLNANQLKWLDQVLYTNRQKLTIIANHQNYIPTHKDETHTGWKDWHKMLIDNAEEAMTVFEKHPQVSLVCTGHRHTGLRYKERNGIYYFNHPAVTSWPMRYTIYTLETDGKLSWESIDIPVSEELHKQAKTNLNGSVSKWWRGSDHPEGAEGDQKMIEYYDAADTKIGTVNLRFKIN